MASKRDKIARRRQLAKTRRSKDRSRRSKAGPPPPKPNDDKKQRMTDLWIAIGIVTVAIAGFFLLRYLSQRGVEEDLTAQTATPPASKDATPSPEATVMSWTHPPEMSLDLDKDYQAIIKTEKGDILIDLYEDLVPVTVNNFVFLARQGYYDGVTFHRVIPGFMAQTGDPTGTGAGGPGYTFADEFTPELRHDSKGIVSMANAGANTNGSQFFFTFAPQPHLDDHHSVFGKVLEGMDVLDALRPRDPAENPNGAPGDRILTIGIVEK